MEAKLSYLAAENARLESRLQNLQQSLQINKQLLLNALSERALFTDHQILEGLAQEQTLLNEHLQSLTGRNEHLEA